MNMNKSKTLERMQEITEELIAIHKAISAEIDFSKLDQKFATYLILGGMVSLLAQARYSIEHGETEKLAQLHRIIPESMDLAMFFSEPGDKTRQIRAWFKGKVIERKPGNKGNISLKERAKTLDTEEQTIINIDKTVKTAIEVCSKYFHPSYDLLTLTYDHKLKNFRYYAKRYEKYSEEEVDRSCRLSLLPVLTAFGISLNFLFLKETVKYLKKIASFTKEIYPNLYKAGNNFNHSFNSQG